MTSVGSSSAAEARQATPLIIAGLGCASLAAGIAIGDKNVAYGAVAFLLAGVLALGEAYRPILSWKTGVVSLLLIIWLIPIKKYRLPVDLPFDLEPYRLLILLLGFLWLLTIIAGPGVWSTGGSGLPLLVLVVASLGALLVNMGRISDAGLQTQALKSLSFFLSYLLAFVLIISVLRTHDELHAAAAALVIGAVIAAVAALYERRSGINLFNELEGLIPLLEFDGRTSENIRAGLLRARSSAQHPIALGAALVMCLPLAAYLARVASTRARSGLWALCGVALVIGAFSTISRTIVLMLLAMCGTVLVLRRESLFRIETLSKGIPIFLAVVLLIKIAAPGSLRTVYSAFTPEGGLIAEQQRLAGAQGSGRIADIGPALNLWLEKPVFGRSLGTGATRADTRRERIATESAVDEPTIIFDNQYLHILVYLGLVGFAGVVWFVWGAVRRIGAAARAVRGTHGDLLVACAASCAAWGVSLAVFDAFAFVQASLIFFAIAALGLRARSLSQPA